MQRTLSAALIIIGNEILSGRTQDANIQFVARKLAAKGIALAEVRVVPDIEDRIIFAVNEIRSQVDYVFTTGGIGPTHDDITAESIAKAFGVGLVRHPEAWARLVEYYGSEDQITGPRGKMATVPEGASLIGNPVSGAPGFKIGNVHVMAGVPKIMQAMLESALPGLNEGAVILSRTVACGMRESEIAEELTRLQKKFPDVDIGSYPQYRAGPGALHLVLRSVDGGRLELAVRELMAIIVALGDEAAEIN